MASAAAVRHRTSPPLSRIARLLVQARFATAVTLAVGGSQLLTWVPADVRPFADVGSSILHGHWQDAYASSWMQAGPFQLLVSWVIMLGSSGGDAPTRWTTACVDVVLVLAAMRACAGRTDLAGAALARRQLLVGVLTALWLTSPALWSGHPAELAIPLLWLFGLRAAGRGRTVRAVVMFALATGFAPWAVLALPALLGVMRPVRAIGTALAALAASVLPYLPWVLIGRFAMFHQTWPVMVQSGPGHLLPDLSTFDWPLRLAQALLVGGGTALVALALRRRRDLVPVLAPLTTAALRIVTDPEVFDYYWMSVAVLVIAALIVAAPADNPTTIPLRTLGLAYGSYALLAGNWKLTGAILIVVYTTSRAVVAYRAARASARSEVAEGNLCSVERLAGERHGPCLVEGLARVDIDREEELWLVPGIEVSA